MMTSDGGHTRTIACETSSCMAGALHDGDCRCRACEHEAAFTTGTLVNKGRNLEEVAQRIGQVKSWLGGTWVRFGIIQKSQRILLG
jgi:hypothetical protein